jgi:outer membrane immunogenic protein
MKKLLLSAAAIVAFAAPALAADLPARTYSKAPAVVVDPTYNWSGFYIGGNLGGAWGRSDYNFLPSGAWGGVFLAQLQADGGARLNMANVSGGAQAGYNWQINQLVLGLEADIQYIGLRKTNIFTQNGPVANIVTSYVFTESSKSDWLATVRGRIGFTVDHVLFYGTGGLAIADSRSSDSLVFPTLTPAATFTGTGSRSDTQLGWTAGGGMEWAFAPNWSVKGEYLYAQFGRKTTVMTPINTTSSLGECRSHQRELPLRRPGRRPLLIRICLQTGSRPRHCPGLFRNSPPKPAQFPCFCRKSRYIPRHLTRKHGSKGRPVAAGP